MADYTVYFNGEWMPFSQVKIDPMDRGFMLGDVVFEVARTFNGKIFRLEEHIDRLYKSLKYSRITPDLSAEEMLNISEHVVNINDHLRAEVGDYTVWQFVTRGPGRWTRSAGPPSICVRISPIDFGRFTQYFDQGAHGVITRTRSYPNESLDSKIKHHSRMNFNLAELEAADVDPEAWPILTDIQGNITEGTGYNIFIVTNGVIKTPGDNNILQGVSRKMVFDLSRQLNIPIIEEDIQPYDLYTADEVFFSSTSYCVLPVTKIDNRHIKDRTPGPITQQILAAWSEIVGVDIIGQALQFYCG